MAINGISKMTNPDTAEKKRLESYRNPDKETYYDQWAATYDQDLQSEGYAGPRMAAQLLSSIVPADQSVMDFGCGSGMVGELLGIAGYQRLYGVDISQGMLEQAEKRQCYLSLRQHDLTTPMVDDIRYQAGVCVGVCSFGPLCADHIAHMTGVLEAGAPLILTINALAWEEKDWAGQLDGAQSSYGFSIDYIKTIPYLVDKGIEAKLLIIRNAEVETTSDYQPEPEGDESLG